MTKPTTTPNPGQRMHPLLFDACRCSQSPGRLCLTCARWGKQYRTITERRRAWRAR